MKEDEFDIDTIMKVDEERNKRLASIEEEGLRNILKHFDRIHDNLFNYNNILIAGFFALGQVDKTVSVKTVIIPLVNLVVLIYIEYKMMEKSRIESNITRLPMTHISKHKNAIDSTNQYSLVIITSTLLVTLSFLYYILK